MTPEAAYHETREIAVRWLYTLRRSGMQELPDKRQWAYVGAVARRIERLEPEGALAGCEEACLEAVGRAMTALRSGRAGLPAFSSSHAAEVLEAAARDIPVMCNPVTVLGPGVHADKFMQLVWAYSIANKTCSLCLYRRHDDLPLLSESWRFMAHVLDRHGKVVCHGQRLPEAGWEDDSRDRARTRRVDLLVDDPEEAKALAVGDNLEFLARVAGDGRCSDLVRSVVEDAAREIRARLAEPP